MTLSIRLLLAVAIVPACGSPTQPGATRELRILAGANITDTAGSGALSPLVMDLRDGNDQPLVGREIIFMVAGCSSACPAQLVPPENPTDPGQASMLRQTDSDGKAQVLLRLGTTAGTGRLAIIAAAGGDSISAYYTILPASIADLSSGPVDTGFYPQATVQLRVAPIDRYGNATTGAVSITTLDPTVATANAKGLVTGLSFGRARFEVGIGALRDTVAVSVVPQFRIAVNLGTTQLSFMGLDGSGLIQGPAGSNIEAVEWIPGQPGVVYSHNSGVTSRIARSNLAGGGGRVTQTDTLETFECYPVVSPDATTVYFSALDQLGQLAVYRVGMSGSGLARTAADSGAYQPNIAPDGDHLAYLSTGDLVGCGIAVLTLSTGSNTCLHQTGMLPRWSPDGTRIAYLGGPTFGGVYVMNADGSGAALLSDPQVDYIEGGLSWSADGAWLLVVRGLALVDLIRVSDGVTLPLRWLPGANWIAFER